jgi:hypothetical protein
VTRKKGLRVHLSHLLSLKVLEELLLQRTHVEVDWAFRRVPFIQASRTDDLISQAEMDFLSTFLSRTNRAPEACLRKPDLHFFAFKVLCKVFFRRRRSVDQASLLSFVSKHALTIREEVFDLLGVNLILRVLFSLLNGCHCVIDDDINPLLHNV